MRKQPETTYAKTDEGYVAYQVFGEGPLDIVLIPSWATNIDVMWEEPSLARYLDRLASFGRVICFDKRGSGVSDPVPLSSLPTLEHWLDDLRVVMDAAGSDRAALIGDTEGGPMAMLFAATFPERVAGAGADQHVRPDAPRRRLPDRGPRGRRPQDAGVVRRRMGQPAVPR